MIRFLGVLIAFLFTTIALMARAESPIFVKEIRSGSENEGNRFVSRCTIFTNYYSLIVIDGQNDSFGIRKEITLPEDINKQITDAASGNVVYTHPVTPLNAPIKIYAINIIENGLVEKVIDLGTVIPNSFETINDSAATSYLRYFIDSTCVN